MPVEVVEVPMSESVKRFVFDGRRLARRLQDFLDLYGPTRKVIDRVAIYGPDD